ncbi:DUF2659 family protein [Rickettsia endosymbiont of Halotydeus destructor]|uniref:DUF2659 family protein n=1 Tax=Rickettsia endosymbiont of Halotydeus destructor TaxID=2996754 RepID=UPI003BAF74C7
MSDILEEVLNDQNEEKRLKFFKKILPVIIVFAIIIVIIMIVNNKYKDKQIKNNQENGDIFVKAIAIETIEGNKALAFNTLESLSNTSNNRIKEIALLEQVAIKISEKNYSDAKALLEKIIQNTDYQEITTAYARVSWLSLIIDEENLNNLDREKALTYLKYFNDEEKAFWATANLIKAIWDIKNDMPYAAKETLKILIASNNAPELTKDQARALLSNLDINKDKRI